MFVNILYIFSLIFQVGGRHKSVSGSFGFRGQVKSKLRRNSQVIKEGNGESFKDKTYANYKTEITSSIKKKISYHLLAIKY